MKKFNFAQCATRTYHRATLGVKKYSPEILVVAGTVGVVASAIMACRATTKIDPILEKAQDDVSTIHEAFERGTVRAKEGEQIVVVPYDEKDHKKDLAIVYAKTGMEFVKLYGPSVAVGVMSLGCILTSHRIMRKRNIALAAAYATIDRSFKDYRGRVIERFGEALDHELKYNIKAQEIEETVVDENGEETVVKKTVNVVDPNMHSDYARFFDDGCKGWEKNPEYNLLFLRQVQNWANERLQKRTYLFLNEVYEMLGIPQTEAGHEVGWVYDLEHPNGDNFVDFGIYDLYNQKARDFVNGHERVILLDFNVDGVIRDLVF